jgi:hypothetical protein
MRIRYGVGSLVVPGLRGGPPILRGPGEATGIARRFAVC